MNHDRLCAPWRNAIIIKLLGKSVSFFTLQSRLHRDWKTDKDFDIIDVVWATMLSDSTTSDCQKILTGGPYKMFDHYLRIQPWEPNFQPARAKIPKTAVWIHLESAPMEQFTGPMLRYLASTLGKPIKIDYTTMLATRGRFARVCVELDLSQTLPVCIKLNLQRYKDPTIIRCAYEGLHKICFSCGEFGHRSDTCRFSAEAKAAAVLAAAAPPAQSKESAKESIFGEWQIAGKKSRKSRNQNGKSPQIDAPTATESDQRRQEPPKQNQKGKKRRNHSPNRRRKIIRPKRKNR